jgi:hypothetical protein
MAPRTVVDPEEVPSAEAVARAVVASARITGEDPVAVVSQRGQGFRARYSALAALIVFYPLCPKSWLGRYVGGCDASNLKNQAQRSKWWAADGERAFEAACAVLEGM